jgi:hypothetical protein
MNAQKQVLGSILVALGCLAAASAAEPSAKQPPGRAKQRTEEEEESLTVRVYDVPLASLRAPEPKPYQGEGLPRIAEGGASSASAMTGRFGIGMGYMGGMGGMGGMRMGGVSGESEPLATAQSKAGGKSAAGGAKGSTASVASRPATPPDPTDELIETIKSTIAPTTWDDVGGPGSIAFSDFNEKLVVCQTEKVHKEIEGLLSKLLPTGGRPTVTVEAHWLLLDGPQLQSLLPHARQSSGKACNVVDAKALEELARSAPGYRGQVTCFSGQTVHIAAGERRTAVLSVTPVVGSGIGYQPVTALPNVGVVLQVTPSLLSSSQSVLVDVDSLVTGWTEAPPFQVQTDTPAQEVSEGGDAPTSTEKLPGRSTRVQIDRVRMPTHELATTLRMPLDKPVLVGGLTLNPDGFFAAGSKDGPKRQLYLILRASQCEE